MSASSFSGNGHTQKTLASDTLGRQNVFRIPIQHILLLILKRDIPSTYIPLLSSLLRRSRYVGTQTVTRGIDTHMHVGDSCLGASLEAECLSDSYNYKINVKHDTREIPPNSHCPSSEKKQM